MHYYANGQKKKTIRKLKAAPRKAIRMAGGLALGATAATAAGMVALTQGDPSKIIQGMAAGGTAGYLAGSNLTNAAVDRVKVEGTVDAMRTDEERSQREKEKAAKRERDDLMKRYTIEDKYGKEVANRIYNGGIIDEAAQFFDDAKDFVAIDNVIQNTGSSTKEAIAAVKMAKDQGKHVNDLGEDAEKELSTSIYNGFRNRGFSNDEAESRRDAAMQRLRFAGNRLYR